ncbi:hypothetical protein Hanom_Chr02g00152741 [Helianthus anomalus]
MDHPSYLNLGHCYLPQFAIPSRNRPTICKIINGSSILFKPWTSLSDVGPLCSVVVNLIASRHRANCVPVLELDAAAVLVKV